MTNSSHFSEGTFCEECTNAFMEFSHYDYVPNELAEKVIAAHGEQLVEEEA